MDIQQILYIAVIIGVFAYRTWQAMQKQKAEDQKRTFNNPAPHVGKEEIDKRPPARREFSFEELLESLTDDPVLPADRYERPVAEEKIEPKNPEPLNKPDYHEPAYKKPVVIKPEAEKKVAEELKSEAIHSKHQHKLVQQEEEAEVAFDGRDAMIKSIILERPQW